MRQGYMLLSVVRQEENELWPKKEKNDLFLRLFANSSAGQLLSGILCRFFWNQPRTLTVSQGTFELACSAKLPHPAWCAAHCAASFLNREERRVANLGGHGHDRDGTGRGIWCNVSVFAVSH